MIIVATKLNLTIKAAASSDADAQDQLIDQLIKVAEANFSKADIDMAWRIVDEQGVLSYLTSYGWAISIS